MSKTFDYVMNTHTLLNEKYRFDFVLSNWVFLWFVLYYYGAVRSSPFFMLLFGLVINTIFFIIKFKKHSFIFNLRFFIWNSTIKVFPILVLFFSNKGQIRFRDIVVSCCLIAVFLFWIRIVNKSFYNNTDKSKNIFDYNPRQTDL